MGCDQLIAIAPSEKADAYMRIWNADGGEVDACGNAARCVGWLLLEAAGRDRTAVLAQVERPSPSKGAPAPAPYPAPQFSATGQDGKLPDYCGSLLAKSISISGSNGFAFHYDENLGGSANAAPALVLNSWRQIRPDDPIFD